MIRIIKATHPQGYYINNRYVLKCNWSFSKYKFTTAEQKAFEDYIKAAAEPTKPEPPQNNIGTNI